MIQPKENIRNLNREKDVGSDRSTFIRLDKNERTSPFPEKSYKLMLDSLVNEIIPMYPDQTVLYSKLSKFLSIEKDHILLTSGSDSAIKSVFETYINSNDKIVYLWPTYAMIDVYANMFNAKKIKIGYSDKLELDFERLINSIDKTVRAVFIANPNQPTGTVLKKKEIDQVINITRKSNSLLVIDEAYIQFGNCNSLKKYAQKFSHVIVIQTFSKAFGLASVRLGYIITHPNNIQWLYKVKSYADINLLAIKFGEFLLDNYYLVEEYVNQIKISKNLIELELNSIGLEVIKGHANFIHIRFSSNIDILKIAEELKYKGYLVRTTGDGLPAVLHNCIRVTVGPKIQMKPFIKDIKIILRTESLL